MPNLVRRQAPAKINLSLLVYGPRADGFHDLHTVMATIDWADDIEVRPTARPGIGLHVSGLPSPSGHDNIVYRAAKLLAAHAGLEPAVTIHLHKRIPSGAGLGGGSSDAAACLEALNEYWRLNLSRAELAGLAAQLGSDVPFFLQGPVAVCTGRGECVEPLAARATRGVLLLIPDIHISTAEVYRRYRPDPDGVHAARERVQAFLWADDLDGLLAEGFNSLKATTMAYSQKLRLLHDQVEAMGIGPVHMSGSGACLFVTSSCSQQLAEWQTQLQYCQLVEVRAARFPD